MAPKTPRKKTKAPTKKQTTKKPIRISRWQKLTAKRSAFLSRRPHRSFSRTYRRDYVRSLDLPGYIAFTNTVLRHIWQHKNVFATSAVVFALLSGALVGLANQDAYVQSIDIVKQTGSSIFSGAWGELGKGALLLTAVASGNFDSDRGEIQQVYAALVFLLIWMSSVWLMRAHIAGDAPRFRDALYNSSAPLVSTLLVGVLFAAQLIPGALGMIILQVGFGALSGVVAMTIFAGAFLLIVLSLYLVTSTFFALIIVTLPGMYPWRAIQIAGDMVVGRRIRIVLRLLWGVMSMIVFWGAIMIPIILGTIWLQSAMPKAASVPIVPVCLVLVSSLAAVYFSCYVYLLYRKVVDNDTASA